MEEEFIKKVKLFRGMQPEDVTAVLSCMGANEKQYEKEEMICCAGESVDSMGLVLSGSVNIVIDDLWGNTTILDHVSAGQLFAETYACIPGEPLMVSVIASEKCRVLFLNAAKMMTICKNACPYHSRLLQNLLEISAGKTLGLSRRSMHTASRTIRGRLVSYLSEQARRSGSSRFAIPFNRQQLADYLSVDRSALSAELGKMQKEGILTFKKNQFCLKEPSAAG